MGAGKIGLEGGAYEATGGQTPGIRGSDIPEYTHRLQRAQAKHLRLSHLGAAGAAVADCCGYPFVDKVYEEREAYTTTICAAAVALHKGY